MSQMPNITQFIANEINFLNKIEGLDEKTNYLQNLSLIVNKNKILLKKEIPAPQFWDSLDICLNRTENKILSHEVKLIAEENKISIKTATKEEKFELLTPGDLIRLLSSERFSAEHEQILQVLLSNSTIFLSLNFILNVD